MNEQPLHSRRRLLVSTVLAAFIAAIILAVAVLPVEYGLDPTGLGARIGLLRMSAETKADDAVVSTTAPQENVAEDEALSVTPLDALWKSPTAFRSDEMSLTLMSGEGAEIKALMRSGERFVFAWETQDGARVEFDMHGEELNAREDEYTSYFKGRAADRGNGAFVAPYAGIHGWYWLNRGNVPATIRLRTSGFYERLLRP